MKYLLAIILMILSVNAVFAQTDDKGLVLGFERSTADAFTKHNLPLLTAVFADNATIIAATGELVTKAQVLEGVRFVYSRTVSDMQVRIEGLTAVVTGIAAETGKDINSVAYSFKVRYTDVLLRTKGQWQIIARQETYVP